MRRREDITLFISSLPVPKTNRYIRRKNGQVFKHRRVILWESRALWEIQRQYDGDSLKHPLKVEVYFFLPDGRKRDIDNMLKTLWDVLQKAGVIEDDNLIRETKTVKVRGKSTHGTVIVIKPFSTPKGLSKLEKLLKDFKRNLDP